MKALCLVKECRELETAFGTKFTEKLLVHRVSKRHLKEIIFKIGRESLLLGGKDHTRSWMGGGVGCNFQ